MLKKIITQLVQKNFAKKADIPFGYLDARWFDRIEKFGSFQAYEYFEGNRIYRDRQKKLFLDNEIRNPVFDYPLINPDTLRLDLTQLTKLFADIEQHEKNSLVKNAYQDKIIEKIIEIKLMQTALLLSKTKNKEELVKLSEKFRKLSEKLYGKPSKKIFDYTVAKIRHKVRMFIGKNKPTDAAAADLLRVLPDVDEENLFGALEKSQIEKFFIRKILTNNSLSMIDWPDSNEKLPAKLIKYYFEKLLYAMNISGWQTHISKNLNAISINHKKKEILIPHTRKLSLDKLKMLLMHEIGVHVGRRQNGENSSLQLLGLGLAGYEVGEEGLAGICEDVMKNSFDASFSNLVSYLAVGLVYGLDGKKRDFRDLFEILHKFYRFKIVKNYRKKESIDLEKVEAKAKKMAWNCACRVFRGSSCQVKGVCFTKDLIYLKGRMCVWDQFRNQTKEVDRLFCGKYDPCNPKHVKILDELGL